MHRFTFFHLICRLVMHSRTACLVTPRDAAVVIDQAIDIDQDMPDMSIDAHVVDMETADAPCPIMFRNLSQAFSLPRIWRSQALETCSGYSGGEGVTGNGKCYPPLYILDQ